MDRITREGYTFQTVLGSMGLNHLNGRIEDSITGRFLSPDPRGTIRGNTQSWNRYSYVNNNPLTFIDPTGFNRCIHDPRCSSNNAFSGVGPGTYGDFYSSDGGPDGGGGVYAQPSGQDDSGAFVTGNGSAQSGTTAPSPISPLDPNYFSTQNVNSPTAFSFGTLGGGGWDDQMQESASTGYAVYIVASVGGQISPFVFGASYSTSFLWNPNTSIVLQYWSVSFGPGLGLSATGGIQTGIIGLDSPNDFTGLGIQASGVVAWDTGVVGTAQGGTGNLGLPGATYSGFTVGGVAGAGASAAAEVTYTRYVGGVNFSQLPQNVQAALCNVTGGC
jgi:RHS repeat-associated protein